MGNPDLYFIIAYTNGRYSVKVLGRDYKTQIEALKMAIADFEQWVETLRSHIEVFYEGEYLIEEIVCS